MFGAFPYAASYFAQAPNIDSTELEHLDPETASIRTLPARTRVRILDDRATVRTLRARQTIQETHEP